VPDQATRATLVVTYGPLESKIETLPLQHAVEIAR
jgi:hypothetical protein